MATKKQLEDEIKKLTFGVSKIRDKGLEPVELVLLDPDSKDLENFDFNFYPIDLEELQGAIAYAIIELFSSKLCALQFKLKAGCYEGGVRENLYRED